MKQPYENLPKVWAWNDTKEGKVLGFLLRETCTGNIVYFKNEPLAWFKYIEPYKEPTKRPMTHKEVFKLMQENLSKGLMTYFKYKSGLIFTYWDHSRSEDSYTYSTDLENWHKLEVEE